MQANAGNRHRLVEHHAVNIPLDFSQLLGILAVLRVDDGFVDGEVQERMALKRSQLGILRVRHHQQHWRNLFQAVDADDGWWRLLFLFQEQVRQSQF